MLKCKVLSLGPLQNKTKKIYNVIIIGNEAAELRSNTDSLCRAMYWNISQICVTLFFCPNLGVSNTPYLGSDVTVLHLLLVVRGRVI